ncbi:MAG: fasciclin domain-containing protein [Gammaproteobacteria bacterium]|nr:fasciclin domain-containing protein [Gammaproteobacteria bacterium]
MKRIIKPIITLLFAAVIVGCSDDDDKAPEPMTIVDVAVENGNFTTLVTALEAADLVDTLDNPDASFTVFAPTDAAFDLLGADTINGLLQDTDTLTGILTYHVLPGAVDASTAISLAGNTADTVNGAKIGLSLDGDNLLVNTATVVQTDITTDNGIIHVIDAVLMPPMMSDASPTSNIVETAVAAGSFTTLVSALEATGLDSVLADESSEFTVFAPTDAAFAMLDPAVLDRLLENPDDLSAILLQHVVAGAVDSVTAYSLNGVDAATAAGTTEMPVTIPLAINSTTDMLTFGGAQIVTKDIHTTNGIIHVIDMVVVADATIPPAYGSIADVAIANGSFDTLVAALTAADLVGAVSDVDSDLTVFAPTDAAFAELGLDETNVGDLDNLSEILLYHVLSSEVKQDAAVTLAQSDMNTTMTANTAMDKIALSLTDSSLYVNTSMVTMANVFADNGVIHVVDKVLMPPKDPETTRSMSNIAELAVANDDLETLVSALTAAELVDALSNEEATFTVFAPTDAAFAALPEGVLDSLLADIPALTDVLELHVISGAEVDSVTAMSLNGKSATTLGGEMVGISIMENMLKVGGANVTITDVYASNGVIHIIDAVITEGEPAM